MKRQLAGALSTLALGWLGNPVWAQEPSTSGLPQPAPVSVVAEAAAPMPTKAGAAPKAVGTETGAPKILAEGSSSTCCPRPALFGHLFNHGGGGCDEGHGFYASAGILNLRPRWNNNPAFATIVNPNATGGISGTQTNFDYGNETTPQVEVGATFGGGFGIRGRYWSFDGSSTTATSPVNDGVAISSYTPTAGLTGGLVTGAGEFLAAASSLELTVWDLEATKEWRNGGLSLLVAGGLRYADLSQIYRAARVDGTGATTGVLSSSSTFDGVGPTVAVEGRLQLGGSGLGVYSKLRGAMMFGTASQIATRTITAVVDESSRSQEHVLPCLEAEIGAEYAQNVGRLQLFVQAGFHGSAWFGAGNAANAEIIHGDLTNADEANDNNANLGFIGLALRAGFRY